jgi:hypothetical protein
MAWSSSISLGDNKNFKLLDSLINSSFWVQHIKLIKQLQMQTNLHLQNIFHFFDLWQKLARKRGSF